VEPTTGKYDLMALPMQGAQIPLPVARTQADERDGQFSPDGRSVAYHSDESGRPEIYVQSFPEPGERSRISTGGGTQPRFREDGREMFYISAANQMMAVTITRDHNGKENYGPPTAIFETRILGVAGVLRQQYVVTPDGQRFLINTTTAEASALPVTVLLNWAQRK
jgi:hypothetical protein